MHGGIFYRARGDAGGRALRTLVCVRACASERARACKVELTNARI